MNGERSPSERNDNEKARAEAPGLRPRGSHAGNPLFFTRADGQVLDLPYTTAWVDGMVLYSLSLHENAGGFRVILKAKRHGRFFVSFINGETWKATLEMMLEFAEKGVLQWWDDKYPPT